MIKKLTIYFLLASCCFAMPDELYVTFFGVKGHAGDCKNECILCGSSINGTYKVELKMSEPYHVWQYVDSANFITGLSYDESYYYYSYGLAVIVTLTNDDKLKVYANSSTTDVGHCASFFYSTTATVNPGNIEAFVGNNITSCDCDLGEWIPAKGGMCYISQEPEVIDLLAYGRFVRCGNSLIWLQLVSLRWLDTLEPETRHINLEDYAELVYTDPNLIELALLADIWLKEVYVLYP